MLTRITSGLFGPAIAGQLLTKGYFVLSMYCGSTLVAGALFLTAARVTQSTRLFIAV